MRPFTREGLQRKKIIILRSCVETFAGEKTNPGPDDVTKRIVMSRFTYVGLFVIL